MAQPNKNDRKKKIEKAALTLFSSKGFHAVSVDSIVLKAGVSKGLFYFHFDNKQALLKALLFEKLDTFWNNIYHEMDESKSVIECMELTLDTFYVSLKKHEKEFRLFISLMLICPGIFDKRIAEQIASYRELYKYLHWLYLRLGHNEVNEEVKLFTCILFGIEMNFFLSQGNFDGEFRKIKASVIKNVLP
jgi:AcrR family transcriptional regulator